MAARSAGGTSAVLQHKEQEASAEIGLASAEIGLYLVAACKKQGVCDGRRVCIQHIPVIQGKVGRRTQL
jgi:putative ubiquitin-RnfH superfamily antitoxin RatB of RatAB toxin-antitoxin module